MSIELREIYRENRGKTEKPSIKTEILEEKQRNQAIKQRKTEETEEKWQKTEKIEGKWQKTEETEQNRTRVKSKHG